MFEIRDVQKAQSYLLHGTLVSRLAPMNAGRLTDALRWAKELASQGGMLPPLGVIADIGGMMTSHRIGTSAVGLPAVPGLEHQLIRRYEDYVLGKFTADPTCHRAADAFFRYGGRERDRAVAYVIQRLSERIGFTGTLLSPAVIGGLLNQPGVDVLRDAWRSVDQAGIATLVIDQLNALVGKIQYAGEAFGREDLFELESGFAVVPLGQRIALRQVLQTAEALRREIPLMRPPASDRQDSAPTRLQSEDQYPAGGFHSITNRGSLESLVRSELVYMDDSQCPDLFDIKYARQELAYYSRDDSFFVRRQLAFVFILNSDLQATRVKDSQLPVQRIVLLLACLCVVVEQLTNWLGEDCLRFELIWVAEQDTDSLLPERQLVESILQSLVGSNTVFQRVLESDEWQSRVEELGRNYFCQTILISADPMEWWEADIPPLTTMLQIDDWEWEEWQRQLQHWLDLWCV